MDLQAAQTFFWLCAGIAIFSVAAFICWLIFEAARLMRQSNEIVEHTRNVVAGIEQDFLDLKEKFGTILGNFAGVFNSVKKISTLVDGFTSGSKDKEPIATKTTKRGNIRRNKLLEEFDES